MSEIILNKNGTITTNYWNPKHRQHIKTKFLTPGDAVLGLLQSNVTLEDGYTLRSLFKLLEKYPVLLWLEWSFINFIDEYKSCPPKGCVSDNLTHIVIAKYASIDCCGEEKELIVSTHVSGKIEGIEETYALDFSPLNTLLDLKLQFDTAGFYKEEDLYKKGRAKKKVEYYPHSYTLWDLCTSIMGELSFHGTPALRDSRMDDLKQRCEDIKNGTAELIPFEDVMKELNIDKDKLKEAKEKLKGAE